MTKPNITMKAASLFEPKTPEEAAIAVFHDSRRRASCEILMECNPQHSEVVSGEIRRRVIAELIEDQRSAANTYFEAAMGGADAEAIEFAGKALFISCLAVSCATLEPLTALQGQELA